MSLPLSAQTFYRMPDQTPAASTIVGLLDALYAALSSSTDYRGTSLASTHLWTVTRYQNAGTTEAVYMAPPSGTSMGLAPRILFAGAAAAAPTMAGPDTFLASGLHVGINKNSGSYNVWTAALPFNAGQWFGFWRAAPTAANSTSTTVRCFVGQETVFVQVIQAATTHYWVYAGAILEPFTTYSASVGLTAESDDRLYGVMVVGSSAAVTSSWLTTGGTFFRHSTSGNAYHSGVFQPTTGTIWPIGWKHLFMTSATTTETQDANNVYVADPMLMVDCSGSNTPNGAVRGVLRNVYPAGLFQSGKVIRNGLTDLYHTVSVDTTSTAHAFLLPAVA
jgi:hypothetical protein